MKAELQEGEVAKLNRTSTRLSQLLSLPWKAGHMSTVRKEQASNGAQGPNPGEGRESRREGLGKPQDTAQQPHTNPHLLFNETRVPVLPSSLLFPWAYCKVKGKAPRKMAKLFHRPTLAWILKGYYWFLTKSSVISHSLLWLGES